MGPSPNLRPAEHSDPRDSGQPLLLVIGRNSHWIAIFGPRPGTRLQLQRNSLREKPPDSQTLTPRSDGGVGVRDALPSLDATTLRKALAHPLEHTHLDELGLRYEGKVRDNYTTAEGRRIIVAT